MHPTGHFVTTAALSAAAYAGTHSPTIAVGVFMGGFLIDLDHYFDYLTFNRQRDPRPSRFLDYYLNLRFDWVVLPLHSHELMAALAVWAYFSPHPLLVGYLAGATLHLTLDLIFNGGVIANTLSFYSFIYRARHGFAKSRLLRGDVLAAQAPARGSSAE